MILNFKNKDLRDFFQTGKSSKIAPDLQKRIMGRLDVLDQINNHAELKSVPGFKFHSLNGFDPTRYTIHVNGPWCITFEFSEGDVAQVDLEQYH
ncbi:plasmid maintenance system killer [Rhizobium sp. N122]|uniref:type II toxin-antitoxin system RelE/ParE family toxin n=1 Tax=Rhizobium sp. N122 TaxID=1764272 RepID=UPI000B5A4D62|nr:type II toxin-antitoxin system RelE/ParE family toxin [Rhizobium sp. N122]OWV65231.1 plasmid maintenance system killer [Rhizobium sp. N122]